LADPFEKETWVTRKKNVNKVRALYKIRYSYQEMFFDREAMVTVFVILAPLVWYLRLQD
jgi:hypothetical protein